MELATVFAYYLSYLIFLKLHYLNIYLISRILLHSLSLAIKMSKSNHRRCAKCGKTPTQDVAISIHRFHKPRKDNSAK